MSHQLMVAIRIRPLNDTEKNKKAFECVNKIDDQRVLLVDPEKFSNDILRQNRQYERHFSFDAVFGPDSNHMQVHEVVTAPLVDYLIDGTNVTVFAYGPTGTGKTYTMMGTRSTPGVMALLLLALYKRIENEKFTIYVSLLEMYNEVIRDLLNPAGDPLDLLEDSKGNVHVPGLKRIKAPDVPTMRQLLLEANSRRTTEPTAVNVTSSRSHAILEVHLCRKAQQSNSEPIQSKLFLIDLENTFTAGSERAANTQNRGQRLKEGASINRSLLALGNVINSLSAGTGKVKYVNYRDSKLTRLLKDSLSGNSRTCMVVHLSPSSTNYDETYNTLLYANRAKTINSRFVRHQRPASADRKYHRALAELDGLQRDAVRNRNGDGVSHSVSRTQLDKLNHLNETVTKLPPIISDSKPIIVAQSNSPVNKRLSKLLPAKNSIASETPRKVSLSQRKEESDSRRSSVHGQIGSLRNQFLVACEQQQKLHERLLDTNRKTYELEISRASKLGIIEEWEKRKILNIQSEDRSQSHKCCEIVSAIQKEMEEQKQALEELAISREKIEQELREGLKSIELLEDQMIKLMRNPSQLQIISLIRRLAQNQAERSTMQSDLALQNLRLKRQEESISKLLRYEQIADRLISDQHITETEKETLQRQYSMIKRQLNLNIIAFEKEMSNGESNLWVNSPLLMQITRRYSSSPPLYKERKSNASESDEDRMLKDDCENYKLPSIEPLVRIPSDDAKQDRTQTDSSGSSTTNPLPRI